MTRAPIVIAPSLLAADFARLGEQVAGVVEAGADWIHLDVMDNHYVPNLTVGPMVCEAIRPPRCTWLDHVMDKIDLVMLMSVNPGFGGQTFVAGSAVFGSKNWRDTIATMRVAARAARE